MQLDYNKRNVDFSKIHATHPLHFQIFFEILKSVPHSKILDIGGGYGSVLIEYFHRFGWPDFQYDIIEASELQVQKGLSIISKLPDYKVFQNQLHYFHSGFLEHKNSPNYYDQILMKMVFHEFPKELQLQVFEKTATCLKPGGHLTVWMPLLNESTKAFFSHVISTKDHFAGFSELASKRHFPSESEFLKMGENAGFEISPPKFVFEYILDTELRLLPEFQNDLKNYTLWLDEIRKEYQALSGHAKNQISYLETKNGIFLRFKRALYQLWLPD